MLVDSWHPIWVALCALLLAGTWQLVMAAAIVRIVPGNPGTRIPMAWILTLPISGAIVVGLELLHLATRTALLVVVLVTLVLGVGGLSSVVTPVLSGFRVRWAAWDRGMRALVVVGAVFQVVMGLYAAHPQRLADQLNYHLLISKLILRDGNAFDAPFDPHVVFAGCMEHGLAILRAFVDDDLFIHAASQAMVFVVVVPAALMTAPALLPALLVGIPTLIPENSIARMAKPDGILFAAVFFLLARGADTSAIAYVCVALAMLGLKLTAGHALIGLVALLVVTQPKIQDVRAWMPLVLLCALPMVAHLLKNWVVLGNPIYPELDAATHDYWQLVAFPQPETWWQKLQGPIVMVKRSPGLGLWLLVSVVTAPREVWKRPMVRGTIAFAAVYTLTWGFFYYSHIFSRFVSPISAAAFALIVLVSRQRLSSYSIMAVAALAFSGLEFSVPRLVEWNRGTTLQMWTSQWSRMTTARAMNHAYGPDMVLVTDAPEKSYFNQRVLYEEGISPAEKEMLEQLETNPSESIQRYRIAALVMRVDSKSEVLRRIWSRLETMGTELRVIEDRVLLIAPSQRPR